MRVNLNEISPTRAGSSYDWDQRSRSSTSGPLTIHFGDVAAATEEFILGSDAVVGCVAWMRGQRFSSALAQRPASIVVNKEFGLRVDGSPERAPLMKLVGGVPGRALPLPAPQDGTLDPVRCAGWATRGRFGALMHHKFMVRLTRRRSRKGEPGGGVLEPTAVWTGSFNLTVGAESNIENGMVITDPAIAQAFLAEFARVYALSEPLLFTAGTPKPGSRARGELRPPAARKKKRAAPKRKGTARKTAVRKAAPKKANTRKAATRKSVK